MGPKVKKEITAEIPHELLVESSGYTLRNRGKRPVKEEQDYAH